MTNAERQAKHKAKLLAEGGAKVVVNVPGAINARLQAAADAAGLGIGAFILQMLDGALPAAPVEPVKAKAVDKGEVYGPTWQDMPVSAMPTPSTWKALTKAFKGENRNLPLIIAEGVARYTASGFKGCTNDELRQIVERVYADETSALVVRRIRDAHGFGSELENAFFAFRKLQGRDMLLGNGAVDFTLNRLAQWMRLDQIADQAPAIRDLFA